MKNLNVKMLLLPLLTLPFMAFAEKPLPKKQMECSKQAKIVVNRPVVCSSSLKVKRSAILKLERHIMKDGVVTAAEAALVRMYKRKLAQ